MRGTGEHRADRAQVWPVSLAHIHHCTPGAVVVEFWAGEPIQADLAKSQCGRVTTCISSFICKLNRQSTTSWELTTFVLWSARDEHHHIMGKKCQNPDALTVHTDVLGNSFAASEFISVSCASFPCSPPCWITTQAEDVEPVPCCYLGSPSKLSVRTSQDLQQNLSCCVYPSFLRAQLPNSCKCHMFL